MKKFLVLAMVATLLTAGSAFAVERHFGATPNATFTPLIGGAGGGPTTTNNDDTCDISVAPAATLLLPYFAVDVTRAGGSNTLFTVTNVSRFPQIAHVTVWTEYSVPVLDFNIFLTGYDVQGISMYDVVATGVIAPNAAPAPAVAGTSSGATKGSMSASNTANPNFAASILCGTLPGSLPTSVVSAYFAALTTGAWTGACSAPGTVGGNHPGTAIGYVTVDVANQCSTLLPTDAGYFGAQILYDNVLIGDYQQLGPSVAGSAATSFDGTGSPMVHIRAIPEGGPATATGLGVTTNLPFTFYDRYTPAQARRSDRRQPLPSAFAARYIENASGFATNFKIWREGKNAGGCGDASEANYTDNFVTEIVRFDEGENPSNVTTSNPICSPNCGGTTIYLPETSLTTTTNAVPYAGFSTGGTLYPPYSSTGIANGRNGGWMYMNLSNGGSGAYSTAGGDALNPGTDVTPPTAVPVNGFLEGPRPSQNWVVIEMFAAPGTTSRLAADFDAAWLGNGCSMAMPASGATAGPGTIGPASYPPNTQGNLVCPPANVTCIAGSRDATNTTPLP